VKGTKTDPVFWVDRLSALFRNPTVHDKDGTVVEHPCSIAICQDLWPAISKVCDKYKADPRIMERVCRCLRYAVRCVGKHSHPFLEPLVVQVKSFHLIKLQMLFYKLL
jgi:transportin-3